MGTIKSISTIGHKIKRLENKLSATPIVENFGEKEQRLLDDFIGDIYEYPYTDRLEINSMTQRFWDWCADYCGT